MLGIIQLINKCSGSLSFTDQDEDLLAAFAGQIGMCIEHVHNSQQLRAQLTKLSSLLDALGEISRAMASFGALPDADALIAETQSLMATQLHAALATLHLKSATDRLKLACVNETELDGMARASEGLLLLFFMLILYFCVFATLLYMFEYQAQLDCRDCPTCGCPAWRGFTSIPSHTSPPYSSEHEISPFCEALNARNASIDGSWRSRSASRTAPMSA